MKSADKNQVQEFLKSQNLITVATSEVNAPWICNVYFASDKYFNLYFVSATDTRHSNHIDSNPNVAFSSAWFNPDNLGDRKSVQGSGKCHRVTDWKEVLAGLRVMYSKFPKEWKDAITVEKMKKNLIQSRLYKISPEYIKYWDDELLGDEGTVEFNF